MAIDPMEEIITEFLDESSVHLDRMNEGLLTLENDAGEADGTEIINDLFRVAHSIKGASGMLGFVKIQNVTHLMESIFSKIRGSELNVNSDVVDILFKGLDTINSLVNDLSTQSRENTEIADIVAILENLLEKGSPTQDAASKQQKTEHEGKHAKQGKTEETVKKPLTQGSGECEEETKEEDQEYADYKQIFMEETEEDVEKLSQGILALEKNPSGKDTINQIFRLSHRIKGASATFGYTPMSILAHNVEDTLTIIRTKEATADKPIIDILLNTVDKFKGLLENIASDSGLEVDINEDIKLLKEWNALKKKAEDPGDIEVEKPSEDLKSTITLTDQDKEDIRKSYADGHNVYIVEIFFEKGIQLGFERTFLIVTSLEGIGEPIKVLPELNKISKDQNINSVIVLLATPHTEAVIRKLAYVDCVTNVEINEVKAESLEKYVNDKGVKKAVSPGNVSAQTSIRVDSSRLDNLMNLAGELIIIRSRYSLLSGEFKDIFKNKELVTMTDDISFKFDRVQAEFSTLEKEFEGHKSINLIRHMENRVNKLSQDFCNLERGIKELLKNKSFIFDLYETTNKLGKVCSGIQTGVMHVRMVPIGPVLKRFARTVRDIARSNNKKIELKIKGEDTELDKNIIDGLSNPLTHMVRNSADHGIEAAEERIAAGKPATGTISLSAYHEGSFICVEVSDDGKGLDLESIKQKAIKSGIKTEDEIASLDKKDIFDLIFLPGFSTAKTVSDISGRGVGMDVVKQKVTELKGSVSIDSEKGKGSKFIIKLPLTLAIITALLVKMQNEVYCIPLESVEEILPYKFSNLYTVEGVETFKLREKVLPLLHFDELFGLTDRGKKQKKEDITIVIIACNGRSAGLAVDSLIGEQDIVIKSLGEEFKNIEGISGASILGSGDLSLILDVGELISMNV